MRSFCFWFCILILGTLPISATAAEESFVDITPTNAYYQDINFLKDTGVVQGVKKNGLLLFEPQRNIGRCEFFKMAVGIYGIDLPSESQVAFQDVDTQHWCHKYVSWAKKKSIIQGQNGRFAPSRTITKAEALKIAFGIFQFEIGKNTQTSFSRISKTDWSYQYASFAESYNILEEGKNFDPHIPAKRQDIAQLLTRTFSVAYSASPYQKEEVLKKQDWQNFTRGFGEPTATKEIAKDAYAHITLEQSIAAQWKYNDIVTMQGKVSIDAPEIVVFTVDSIQRQKVLRAPVKDGKFSLSFPLSQAGSFLLGIVPSNKDQTMTYPIWVSAEKPQIISTQTDIPTCNLNLSKDTEDRWFLSLKKEIKNGFFQVKNGSFQKTFRIKNTDTWYVPKSEFSFWPEGVYDLEFVGINSWSDTKALCKSALRIPIVKQHFSFVDNRLNIDGFETSLHLNETLYITGSANAPLRPTYEIIQANGSVESYPLTDLSNILPKSTPFSLEFTPNKKGVYFLEINHENGIAMMNSPLYVGTMYPLFPDYQYIVETYRNGDMHMPAANDGYQILLKMVNEARVAHGKNPVTLDTKLTTLSQNYAEYMKNNNFFGHVTPTGQTPDDRRKELGIKTGVGENIAQAFSLRGAHEGFMRSAIHRANVLDAGWETVGFGFAKNTDGTLIVVQEFSYDELTEQDKELIAASIRTKINNLRNEYKVSTLSEEKNILGALNQWTKIMAQSETVDTEIGAKSMNEILANAGYKNFHSGIVLSGSSVESLLSYLKNYKQYMEEEVLESFQVSVDFDADGTIYVAIVFLVD